MANKNKNVTIKLNISVDELYKKASKEKLTDKKIKNEFIHDLIDAIEYQLDWVTIIQNLSYKYDKTKRSW
jgi:hypothetical protein